MFARKLKNKTYFYINELKAYILELIGIQALTVTYTYNILPETITQDIC